ncbi:MAG: hypothetical protein E7384_04325 [Ruminococcaceae bacterium]|nr:hypothetical protein [Oscillospiraceae bacterium]
MSKRITSFLLALCLVVTSVFAGVTLSDTAITAEAATAGSALNYQVFRQTDQNYGNYDPSGGAGCTIQKNGCGIMSIVNAVYHLNGNIISLKDLFTWAYSTGGYGTSGTTRYTIYPALQAAFGAKYGFTVGTMDYGTVSDTRFINHLKNGGTAIVHVYNHFMCIAGYDSASGRYLLIDPAANWDTRHSSAGGNWMTAAELTGGINSHYLTIDWWCLLSKATASCTNYTATANVAGGQGSVFFYDDVSSARFAAGTTVFFRPVPASGYKVTSVTVNGTALSVQNGGNPSIYAFTMPSANCTINVGFSTGGAGHANATYTSAASYALPAGIVARTDSARPNSYVGLFANSTTSYSKSTAITYFSAPAYYYIGNATAEGYTTQLQAGKIGGNYGAYGSTGTFKVVTFDTAGNVYGNATITVSGSDAHAAAITYGRGSVPPGPTTYKATAKVAAGQGTVHFGNNVTSADVYPGTTVNYQVTPAAGYKATKILVYGTSQTIKNNGGDCVYQFTMEAADVTVSVTFEQDFASSLDPADVVFDCDAAGQWVSNGSLNAATITLATTEKGDTALKITASASDDPSITMDYSLLGTMSATTNKYMIVTAMTSASNTNAKMYLCPGSITGATEDCAKGWQWNNDGLWHDYVIDLSGLSKWTGNLNSIRFDFFDGTTAANSVLWLRSIRFTSSKPTSPTVKPGATAYAVGDDIMFTYSGLDSYMGTKQNAEFFVGLYEKGQKPGSTGSLLYTIVTAKSGSGNITTSAVGGTMKGQTIPAGNYTLWIAYDAKGSVGTYNLGNVMFDADSASYDFVIEEASVGEVIVKVNTSDIEALSGKKVSSAIVELTTLLGTSATITKDGETVANTATLGTGMVVTAGNKTYDIVIEGDVDGDGSVNIADATAAMAGVKDASKVTGAYAKAALAVNNKTSGALSILEVMAILNKI